MEPLTIILIGITILFFLLLAIKKAFNIKPLCPICLSVTLTWMALLILYFTKTWVLDKTIIAIMMGMTSLGIYYKLENKVQEKLTLFRLPFILTAIFITYSVLQGFKQSTLIFILIIWLLFTLLYFLRNIKSFKSLSSKIIECCKKW